MRFIECQHVASLLPLWAIEEDTLITTHGSYLRMFEVIGLPSEYVEGSAIEGMASTLYERAKTDLPVDLFMQFVVVSHSDYEDVWRQFDAVKKPGTDLLAYQRDGRRRFMRAANARRHSIYLAVGSQEGMSFKEFETLTAKTHQKRLKQCSDIAQQICGFLCDSASASADPCAELRLLPMSGEDITRVIYTECNGGRPFKEPPKEGHWAMSLRERLMQADVIWTPKHVQVGSCYQSVLTLKNLPNHTKFTMMEDFLAFDFDTRLSVNFRVTRQGFTHGATSLKRGVRNSVVESLGASTIAAADVALTNAEQLDETVATTGQLYIDVGMQIVISADSEAKLKRCVRVFKSAMRTKAWDWYEETSAHDREVFKTVPGMGLAFNRWRKVLSNSAVDLMPIFGSHHGDRTPVFLMKTVRGELFSFDPAEHSRNCWNAGIFGATGSGKTVFVTLMLMHAILAGPSSGPVMVVDYAGPNKSTYKRLVALNGGIWAAVNADEGHSINPLPPPSDALGEDGRVKSTVFNFLSVFLDLLLGNEGTSRDAQLDRGILQLAITKLYRDFEGPEAPLLSDYAHALDGLRECADVDQRRRRELSEILTRFLESPNARVVNRHTTLKMDSRFIVLDLFGIKTMPDNIREAVFALVSHVVQERAFSPVFKDQIKYIFFDECAELTKSPVMVDLIGRLYCTARGYLTAIFTIIQEYQHYKASPLAGTITMNSSTFFFLTHEREQIARALIAHDMSFNEMQKALFFDLKTIKGKFAEILVQTVAADPISGDPRPITCKVALELSPFDALVATSDVVEKEQIQVIQEKHPDWTFAQVLQFMAAQKEGVDNAQAA